jgi:hypothetical protein
VDVLDDPQAFRGGGNLGQRGQLSVRENIFLDPGIGGDGRAVAADRVEQEQSIGTQQLARFLEVRAVVAHPHVLEHTEGIDGVVVAAHAAVVLQLDVYRQARATALCGLLLVLRYRHAGYSSAIALGHELRGSSPAAADVEDPHPSLEPQLARDEVELRLLRRIQRAHVLPVGARVDHAGVEHALVKVIAEIIVLLPHLEGAAPALHVDQVGRESQHHPAGRAQVLLDIRPEDASQHLVQLLAVPPAIHVGLAGAEGALREYPLEEALIVYPDVPRTRSVYFDVGALEQLVHCPLV